MVEQPTGPNGRPQEPADPVDPEFEVLMERYYEDCLRFAKHRAGQLLSEKFDYHDLAQTACGKVLEEARREQFQYRSDEEFKRYLLRAVELKIVDKCRYYMAEKRKASLERPLHPHSSVDVDLARPDELTPSEELRRIEQKEELLSAIGELSPQHRAVIVHYYIEKKTLEETAHAIGMSIGAVRSRLNGALARLSGILPSEI